MRTCACVASHRKSITKRCESALGTPRWALAGVKCEGRKGGDGPPVSGNGRKWEWPDRDKTHMVGT